MIAIVLSVVFLVITMLAFWVSKHGDESCVLKFRIATKNGRQLTYNEYLKETSPETRSRKNPTLRIWYEESGPPNNTSIKHTECVKL